jgi:predicted nucleotidyltransferase
MNLLNDKAIENKNYKDKNEILQILKQHKEELYKKYGVKEIGIFGSFARGEVLYT